MKIRLLVSILIVFLVLPQTAVTLRIPEMGVLARAVAQEDLSLIDELLLLGADPDQQDAAGKTPLIYAVDSGQYNLVKRILTSPANPDLMGSDGLSPLMKAVKSGREDLIALLLNAGANPNLIGDSAEGGHAVSALSIAIDAGLYGIARRLMEAGADGLLLGESVTDNPLDLPVCDIPLDSRIWRGLSRMRDNADSPEWIHPRWSLHRAVRDGDWYETAGLLNDGANPNSIDSEGVSPLMAAAWHGHAAVASSLLQWGGASRHTDRYGVDALGYAVAGGHLSIVDLLLTEALKSNPERFSRNAEPLEASPYYWAIVTKRADILNRLIDFKLGLPEDGREGITLLMVAAWLSDTFAVSRLVSLAAEALAYRDEAGRTALEWSAAAFDRDRRTGLAIGIPIRGARNYSAARILAGQTEEAQNTGSGISPYIREEVMQAWSPGGYGIEDKQDTKPSPSPRRPKDGDLVLYRIFRNEEP